MLPKLLLVISRGALARGWSSSTPMEEISIGMSRFQKKSHDAWADGSDENGVISRPDNTLLGVAGYLGTI